jgi:hypothetical protein
VTTGYALLCLTMIQKRKNTKTLCTVLKTQYNKLF